MKYFYSSVWLLSISALLCTADFAGAQVIPAPLHLVKHAGVFHWNGCVRLYTNLKGEEKTRMDDYFRTLPFAWTEGNARDRTGVVRLIVAPSDELSGREAYRLKVTPEFVEITGNTGTGLFYGLQTLLQLAGPVCARGRDIPCVEVKDRPRFGYRGFMLDVSRHFFPKEFIFKMIDILAYYKINIFHFHLADTGGWRVEMETCPALTEQTAYRPAEDLGRWWGMRNVFCLKNDSAYGGCYTKQDIREIVNYATTRQITVIPEIDMPGHSRDVLCACPQLACESRNYLNSNELCIGKEETFRFCENMLEEIIDLFPGHYIHIGGDEADRNVWSACSFCRKRMQEQHLTTTAELQNYFTNRMEKFLHARGKTLIGWDEILDGEVSERAVVMSWREEADSGGEALRRGHPVIMAPTSHCYLDYYQDNPYTQPKAFGYIPLEKVYGFEPVPPGVAGSSSVLGVQGNLWTEHIATVAHAEYMVFPRILAIAEVGWTAPELKSYPDFRRRALQAIEYLKSKGYHPFELKSENGPRPEAQRSVSHLAAGKKAVYLKPPNKDDLKGAGAATLTDGRLGDWGAYGSRWQGFYGDMDVVVDLASVQEIHAVEASFMQVPPAGLWLPTRVEIAVSDNGEDFSLLFDKTYAPDDCIQYDIVRHGWSGRAKTRYIRFHATRDLSWGNRISDEIIVR